MRGLVSRWRTGPIGAPPRPPRPVTRRRPIFSVRSWNEERDGDVSRPRAIAGQAVIEQLRIRRDHPGGLWVLADGRYAVTGSLAAIGSRRDLAEWARRRMRGVSVDERAGYRPSSARPPPTGRARPVPGSTDSAAAAVLAKPIQPGACCVVGRDGSSVYEVAPDGAAGVENRGGYRNGPIPSRGWPGSRGAKRLSSEFTLKRGPRSTWPSRISV